MEDIVNAINNLSFQIENLCDAVGFLTDAIEEKDNRHEPEHIGDIIKRMKNENKI